MLVMMAHRPRNFLRETTITAALSLIATAGCSPIAPTSTGTHKVSPESRGRNIILVLSDTHRLDHTSGFLPGIEDPTPHVARLVLNGVAFDNAWTPIPISAPAYATLMTGLLPTKHGLLNNEQHLSPSLPLLQEELHEAGYRTAAVVSNPYCSSGHGFARGFDHYWDQVEGNGKEGEIVTSEAIAWLESEREDEPFFLFVAYMDAHAPYTTDTAPPSLQMEVNNIRVGEYKPENSHIEQHLPLELQPGRNTVSLSFLDIDRGTSPADAPSPLHVKGLRLASGLPLNRSRGFAEVEGTGFERLANRAELVIINPEPATIDDELVFRCYRLYRHERIPAFYEAGVRSFDRSFGRLTDYLQTNGLFDDAIVVFVADHGEMLGEHAAWGHVGHLWAESLRIPLVIKAPGLQSGLRSSSRVGLRDLHDLILEMACGSKDDRIRAMEARRQAPFVAITFPPEASTLQVAVIQDNLKVVVEAGGNHRVFDLETDPEESTDIADHLSDNPTVGALLTTALAELAAASTADSLDLGAMSMDDKDRLRALGYLQGADDAQD